MVLFDLSGSAASDTLRAHYGRIAEALAQEVRPGDRYVGLLVTDQSTADGIGTFEVKVPTEAQSGLNALTVRPLLDSLGRAFADEARRVLAAAPSACTDLGGALALTSRQFKASGRDSSRTERRLVVMSDMVSTCGAVVINEGVLSEHGPEAAVAKLQAAGQVPELPGVEVYVAGAGTDRHHTAEAQQRLEAFWQAYFAAAGAHLAPEHYGPTLMGWP